MNECHEEVTRKGNLEPCEKPAVAMRIDPTEGNPYPVCIKHTRADMVPLQNLLPAERRALTVALAQVQRDEVPATNTMVVCIYALARLTGRYDWTAGAADE